MPRLNRTVPQLPVAGRTGLLTGAACGIGVAGARALYARSDHQLAADPEILALLRRLDQPEPTLATRA
jgi:NAD(P)-dependent dehydrogenase (short-subunit alcohol dehydrogenase family)